MPNARKAKPMLARKSEATKEGTAGNSGNASEQERENEEAGHRSSNVHRGPIATSKRTSKKRAFEIAYFNGTRVQVAGSILRKWEEIPEEKKSVFYHAAHEALTHRMVKKAWRNECNLYESIGAAGDALRGLFTIYRMPPDGGESISCRLETDSGRLRDAAKALTRAAKELHRQAGMLEGHTHAALMARAAHPCSIPELLSILCNHWVHPTCICLCWMSSPALAKFLRLTVASLKALTDQALEKERYRLGLPKLDHSLVELSQVYREGKTVYLDGSSFSRPASH
jgi:hypothetical protein